MTYRRRRRRNADEGLRRRERAGRHDPAQLDAWLRQLAESGQMTVSQLLQYGTRAAYKFPPDIRGKLFEILYLAVTANEQDFFSDHKRVTVCPRGHELGNWARPAHRAPRGGYSQGHPAREWIRAHPVGMKVPEHLKVEQVEFSLSFVEGVTHPVHAEGTTDEVVTFDWTEHDGWDIGESTATLYCAICNAIWPIPRGVSLEAL